MHRITTFLIDSISENNIVGTQNLAKNISLEVRRQPLFLCFLKPPNICEETSSLRRLDGIIIIDEYYWMGR